MAVNKVVYGGETIIDISDSTVTPDTLAAGTIAYNAAGEKITGKMESAAAISIERIREICYTQSDFEKNYTKVEYIESSGTQYIDTGVSGGTNAAYALTFNPLSLRVAYEMYFAGPKTAPIPKLYGQSTGLTIEVGTSMSTQSDFFNADHAVTVNSDGTAYFDGVAVTGLPSFAGTGWGDSTWWVCNAHGEPTLQSSMRIYSLKMWTDGVLVRDFVPCKNKSGVAGLYDVVNEKFYKNAGTGSFTAGAEIA